MTDSAPPPPPPPSSPPRPPPHPSAASHHPFDELPELTLSLRSFGSGRRSSAERQAVSEEQERYFGPLLDARRAAASARTREQVVAAFEPRRLTAHLEATLRGFAAERFPTRASARRAFEARLFEIIEPLRAALQLLDERATEMESTTARVSEVAELHGRWEAWLAQLRVTFRVADDSWAPLCAALDELPRAPARPRVSWPGGRGGAQ